MSADLVTTVVESALNYSRGDEQAKSRPWLYNDPGFTARIALDEFATMLGAFWQPLNWPPATPAIRRVLALAGGHPSVDLPLGPAAAIVAGVATGEELARAALSPDVGLRTLAAIVSRDPDYLNLMSQDPCVLVRAAVAFNRSTPPGPPHGLWALASDPVRPIRDLLRDPTFESIDDGEERDDEEERVSLGMSACSCVAQSGLPRSLERTFRERGLMLPASIPSLLETRIREFGPWRWASQPFPEPMDHYVRPDLVRYLRGPVPDQVSFSHAGYGANSYSLDVRVAVGPLAALVQIFWGGIYGDEATESARWNEAMAGLSTVLQAIDIAPSAGLQSRDVVVVYTEFSPGFQLEFRTVDGWETSQEVTTWSEAAQAIKTHLQKPSVVAVEVDLGGRGYPYDPPDRDESAVVGVAVVELQGGEPFAVAAIRNRVSAGGDVIARLEAVLRRPFDVNLGGGHLANPLKALGPEALIHLVTDRGPMTVRHLRPEDGAWLSSTQLDCLPVGSLEQLVRVLHEVEAEQGDDAAWSPFSESTDEPVEFIAAFVSDDTESASALAYSVGLNDSLAWASPVLRWRVDGRWQEDPPDTDRAREYQVKNACAAPLFEAFDSGARISEDTVYAATLKDTKDYSIWDFSPRLRDRLDPVLAGIDVDAPDLGSVDLLISFAAGRAFLDRDVILDMLQSFDSGHGVLRDWSGDESGISIEVECATWISTVDFEPGADAHRGGPWRLVVTRTSGPPFTLLDRDDALSRAGMEVLRGTEGSIIRVTVASSMPFYEAAHEFGLELNAFGSPTIWLPGVSGWTWTNAVMAEPFPFVTESDVEN